MAAGNLDVRVLKRLVSNPLGQVFRHQSGGIDLGHRCNEGLGARRRLNILQRLADGENVQRDCLQQSGACVPVACHQCPVQAS